MIPTFFLFCLANIQSCLVDLLTSELNKLLHPQKDEVITVENFTKPKTPSFMWPVLVSKSTGIIHKLGWA